MADFTQQQLSIIRNIARDSARDAISALSDRQLALKCLQLAAGGEGCADIVQLAQRYLRFVQSGGGDAK